MKSIECSICNITITNQDNSKEHIIPKAIGGRKKVSNFICDPCNNGAGGKWDNVLAQQLNPLSLFFKISREKGKKVPKQSFKTTTGEELTLNHDGTMNIKSQHKETNLGKDKVMIEMMGSSLDEIKKRLKGIAKKYPKADLDKMISDAKDNKSYCPDPIKFELNFGGKEAGKSMVKSALALVSYSKINPKICKEAINYIQQEGAEACFGYYYEKDLIVNRPQGIPLHLVYIRGDVNCKKIFAYLEFFGCYKTVMCLSNDYEGSDFLHYYAINPLDGQELNNIDINWDLSYKDVRDSYGYKKIPNNSIVESFNKVIPTGINIGFKQEQDRVINEAIEYAFSKCGDLTEENLKIFTSHIMEKLLPFVLNNARPAKT